jgi:hypothetical protein
MKLVLILSFGRAKDKRKVGISEFDYDDLGNRLTHNPISGGDIVYALKEHFSLSSKFHTLQIKCPFPQPKQILLVYLVSYGYISHIIVVLYLA